MLRTSPKAGRSAADAQLFLHAPQQVFQVFQAAQGFQASGQALLFLAGQGRRMRRSAPGASRRSRSQTQAPGGQGWRRGGGSAHGTIIARTGVRAATPVALASALQRFSGTLPCCSRPLRMA